MVSAATTKVSAVPRRHHTNRSKSYPTQHQADDYHSSFSTSERNENLTKSTVDVFRTTRAEYYDRRPGLRRSCTQKEMAGRSRRRRDSESIAGSMRDTKASVREGRRWQENERSSGRETPRRRSHEVEEVVYVHKGTGRRVSEPPRSPTTRRSSYVGEPSRTRDERSVPARTEPSRRRSEKRSSHHYEREHIPLRSEKRSILESVQRSSRDRPAVERSASVREPPPASMSRPSLRRSQTSTRKSRPLEQDPPLSPYVAQRVERTASVRRPERPSSFLGSIFSSSRPQASSKPLASPKPQDTPRPASRPPAPRPAPRPQPKPEKQVECLTCLDEYPVSKTAHLLCDHRMCHSCLRRIFTLSITDPQHMPPKCCTTDHIDLKHVDKLFDLKFKKQWNQKYREFTTKNRIYCPQKNCGEWIKPSNIHTDISGGANGGRKYGKCSRCRTKVCCTCNSKWHTSRACPKDPATQEFIKIAKKEGWVTCFNCKATIELKEGCNHMTCRCRAEFCMICSKRWKTCDCPWFNYEAVEADRLHHMGPAFPRRVPLDFPYHPHPPFRYQEELDRRRDQERRDEAFARRIQVLGLDDEDDLEPVAQEWATGNAAAHLMNEHFVRRAQDILSGTYTPQQHEAADRLVAEHHHRHNNNNNNNRLHPPPPPRPQPQPQQHRPDPAPEPALRRHTPASRAHNQNPHTRESERVVPARRTHEYAAEAEMHRPDDGRVGNGHGGRGGRASMLAGITAGTGEGRVHEWRRHVVVGV